MKAQGFYPLAHQETLPTTQNEGSEHVKHGTEWCITALLHFRLQGHMLQSAPNTSEAVLELVSSVMNTGHFGLDSLPSNLTFVDIKSPLRHVAHPSLRFLATECVEVVDIRGFVRDFKIADTTVTLQKAETRNVLLNRVKPLTTPELKGI